MNRKEPHLITFENIQDTLLSAGRAEVSFAIEDFAMSYHVGQMFDDVFMPGVPYLLNDSRIILVVEGEADITVNLVDYHISPRTAAFFCKGSTIQVNRVTDDLRVDAIAFSDDYVSHLMGTPLFKTYEGRLLKVLMMLSAEEMEQAGGFFALLWQNVQSGLHSRELLSSQITSILYFLHVLYEHHQSAVSTPTARNDELFHQFINLVNTHHTRERTITFYADRLCITDKYLCLVVKQVSGFTPKEWINRALITSAKVMLKRTGMQVVQISDRLNFPHPSSFCKFFKRETCMTPAQYRAT